MLMNAEAGVSRRYINHPELHPFDPIPAVEAQRAGGVHGSPAALPERVPEFLSGGAKRDGVDDRAIAGAQPRTYMRLPDLFEIGAERAQRILAQRDAGCHGVAAALNDETCAHGVAHRAAEVDTGDRTP